MNISDVVNSLELHQHENGTLEVCDDQCRWWCLASEFFEAVARLSGEEWHGPDAEADAYADLCMEVEGVIYAPCGMSTPSEAEAAEMLGVSDFLGAGRMKALKWAQTYWDGAHETWEPPLQDSDGRIVGPPCCRTEADLMAEQESLADHLGVGFLDMQVQQGWDDPEVQDALDAGYEQELDRWHRAHGLDWD